MIEQSDTDFELFFLRRQIEIRMLHLGVDSRLRRRIVKAIARISNVHKLTMIAYGLGSEHRERLHSEA